MGAPDLLHALQGQGLTVWAKGDCLLVAPKARITDETRKLIRAHKAELLAALAEPELFTFTPPGDPANDDEALRERVAVMIEGNGWDEATALREARWCADRERYWRGFLCNAQRILDAPRAQRAALLARYQREATKRYGEQTGTDMAASLRNWIAVRGLH